MMGTVMARQELNAAEAWALVEAHRIGVFPCLDGRIWRAWAERFGSKPHNRRRAIGTIEADGSTALQAVSALAAKLEQEQQTLDFNE